jgi:hypothetical protein
VSYDVSAIDNPASCEIRTFIRFLHAKNMSAAEIHRALCAAVYGQSVMSEGTVSYSKTGGRTDVHDEERSGRLAFCSE